MAQIIKLKRSAVPGQVPTAAQLDLGELAINTNDGKLYFKKEDGGVEGILEVGGSQSGEASKVTSSLTAPVDPAPAFGDLWFDTNDKVLKYYDGAAWAEVGEALTDFEASGDANLGSTAADALTVAATSTFSAPATFTDDTNLGDSAADALTVGATATFNAPATFNDDTNLGDSAADTLTVGATSTFNAPATFNGGVTIQSGDTFTFDGLAFNNAHKLTISNVSGTTVFGGWVLDTDTNTAN